RSSRKIRKRPLKSCRAGAAGLEEVASPYRNSAEDHVDEPEASSEELPALDEKPVLGLSLLCFTGLCWSAFRTCVNVSFFFFCSQKRLRFFFSSLLRTLPGVQRRWKSASSSSSRGQTGVLPDRQSTEPWRDFDRSKVYTADLESALHYLLRVELATHSTLEGEELKIFKDFVTLVAKLYPGGGSVVKLMETLSDWLLSLPLQRIPYQAVLDLVDNKMRISGVFLGAELRWVGCQGSRAGLRGYPCSLWTLFHVLTVQHDATPAALENTGLEAEAAPVLQVMRRYIRTFFGCEQCGRHFEQAAAASMEKVRTREDQVLWLWNQHNRVNYRLAGTHRVHL
ncbi:sulfhydryl oxidase 2-like, partial [Micropterus dolomieu]|uniref:sulfhydryl oxidase 2-like n=1 Tax=Micropterus dolomieu TaxID=147949 RepID=UPI001E8E8C76